MKLYEVMMAHIRDILKPNLNAIKNVKKGDELYVLVMPINIKHILTQLKKAYNKTDKEYIIDSFPPKE